VQGLGKGKVAMLSAAGVSFPAAPPARSPGNRGGRPAVREQGNGRAAAAVPAPSAVGAFTCELCEAAHSGRLGSGRFCSIKCARSFAGTQGGQHKAKTSKKSSHSASADAGADVDGDDEDTRCSECSRTTHAAKMLLCDSCDDGYHMFCLKPPLRAIPEGDWQCAVCISCGLKPTVEQQPQQQQQQQQQQRQRQQRPVQQPALFIPPPPTAPKPYRPTQQVKEHSYL